MLYRSKSWPEGIFAKSTNPNDNLSMRSIRIILPYGFLQVYVRYKQQVSITIASSQTAKWPAFERSVDPPLAYKSEIAWVRLRNCFNNACLIFHVDDIDFFMVAWNSPVQVYLKSHTFSAMLIAVCSLLANQSLNPDYALALPFQN